MTDYTIRSFRSSPRDSEISAAAVSCYPWGGAYRPECEGRLFVVGGTVLTARMRCRESAPRALCREFCDPVCTDSCMEWFFSLTPGGEYVNCEMNSAGVSHIAFGAGREGRTRIDRFITPPRVSHCRRGGWWSVGVSFSLDELRTIFGDPSFDLREGREIYFNMYKCGDLTETPHYGAWRAPTAPEPDFHRPECFGRGVIAASDSEPSGL